MKKAAMRTFYVEFVNKTDIRDNEARKIKARSREEALIKASNHLAAHYDGVRFDLGRCASAMEPLAREFRSYCSGDL